MGNALMAVYLMLGSLGGNDGHDNKIVGNDMHYEVTTNGNVPHFGRKSEREAPSGESYGSSWNNLLINKLEKCITGGDVIMGYSKQMSYVSRRHLKVAHKRTNDLDYSEEMSNEVLRRNRQNRALHLDSVNKVFETMLERLFRGYSHNENSMGSVVVVVSS
ncbi:hypothetical protein RHGRI_038491 [Rhododendron griersonianum]|uniref:Uncharacterized protein n=1 Tax=Rhododendron griersonianum TaxID=479676 RepID=A0AAV6HJV9_9ERIC|nr:hypothetical protein RHGRI_038491 [Rhododendron griersonianum]